MSFFFICSIGNISRHVLSWKQSVKGNLIEKKSSLRHFSHGRKRDLQCIFRCSSLPRRDWWIVQLCTASLYKSLTHWLHIGTHSCTIYQSLLGREIRPNVHYMTRLWLGGNGLGSKNCTSSIAIPVTTIKFWIYHFLSCNNGYQYLVFTIWWSTCCQPPLYCRYMAIYQTFTKYRAQKTLHLQAMFM